MTVKELLLLHTIGLPIRVIFYIGDRKDDYTKNVISYAQDPVSFIKTMNLFVEEYGEYKVIDFTIDFDLRFFYIQIKEGEK